MILNITKLNKELSALRTEKQEFTVKLTSHEEEKHQWHEEKAKLEKKIEELLEEHKKMEDKIAEHKKEEAAVVIAVEESVNKKVVQNLAAMGVPEGTVKDTPVESTTNTAEDTYKKYESLTGKDKVEFFKKNEKTILSAMKRVHFIAPSNLKTQYKSPTFSV